MSVVLSLVLITSSAHFAPFSAQGKDSRDKGSAPDATFQAIADCEIECKEGTRDRAHSLGGHEDVMVIIYLFNLTETKDALFVHVCFCALART